MPGAETLRPALDNTKSQFDNRFSNQTNSTLPMASRESTQRSNRSLMKHIISMESKRVLLSKNANYKSTIQIKNLEEETNQSKGVTTNGLVKSSSNNDKSHELKKDLIAESLLITPPAITQKANR